MTKGYCPTGDPAWRHVHQATGKTRECARHGCVREIRLFCHSGHRKYCPGCSAAVRRISDRTAKARRRADAKHAAADQTYNLASLLIDGDSYAAHAAKLRDLGIDYREAKRLMAEWTDFELDSDFELESDSDSDDWL